MHSPFGLRSGAHTWHGMAARALQPSLFLNFAGDKALDPRITFTRASSATFYDAQGVLQTAANDVPRFDHNPATGESLGLLIEVQRTNLLLNSDTLATQSVTVTAAAHTLSFFGTGTVTLTGVSTAGPLVGTGANDRVNLTFTPTAGTLTLTVSGTVTLAQLEAGAFPTSYIPTTGATVTRAADAAIMTGANFSSWYRADEGTAYVESAASAAGIIANALAISDGTLSNRMIIREMNTLNQASSIGAVGGTTVWGIVFSGQTAAATKFVLGYKTDDIAFTRNGVSPLTDTSATIPTVNQLRIGSDGDGLNPLNGTIRKIAYYPFRLPNAILQALTS